MKVTCTLTVMMCVVVSVSTVAAQNTTERAVPSSARVPVTRPTAGPLVRAVTRETTRLAATPPTSGLERGQQSDEPARSDWSHVRALTPGAAVVVTLKGSPPTVRYVVQADETDLTTLRLDNRMSTIAKERLLEAVSQYPESFTSPSRANQVVDKDMQIGPDGIFVAGTKVARLDHVVEKVARVEVEVVSRPVPTRGSVGRVARGLLLGMGGYFAGAIAGGMVGGAVHCWVGTCETQIPTGAVVGLVAGGGAGAIAGYHWGSRPPRPKPADIIYRAP